MRYVLFLKASLAILNIIIVPLMTMSVVVLL